jgi:hypothetical protein
MLGVVYEITALHAFASLLTLCPAGQVIVGAWLSVIVTAKLHDDVKPAPSVTVNMLVVTLRGNAELLTSPLVCDIDDDGQLSDIDGEVYVTVRLH